jgi:hypothetical protein
MVERGTLPVIGYRGLPVPNTFMRQPTETAHLAVLWPGYRYRVTMPALYYAGWMLWEAGADLLCVETAYDKIEHGEEPGPEERYRWLVSDAEAVWDAVRTARGYGRVTLVAKSISTLALGHLVLARPELAQAECVWLTPLLHEAKLRAQIVAARPRSLFAAGTADKHYDAGRLAALETATGGTSIVIPGADHSLEIKGDVQASMAALARVMAAVQDFLAGAPDASYVTTGSGE